MKGDFSIDPTILGDSRTFSPAGGTGCCFFGVINKDRHCLLWGWYVGTGSHEESLEGVNIFLLATFTGLGLARPANRATGRIRLRGLDKIS